MKPSSFVEAVLKNALKECKEEEISFFFVERFEQPLIRSLVQDDNILAEKFITFLLMLKLVSRIIAQEVLSRNIR